MADGQKQRTMESDLDELQLETEKLLMLLKDRQPGIASWFMFLFERMEKERAVISRILGK